MLWKSFNDSGLSPRFSADYRYLGEDCRNKRHFDCEGFVAWVIVEAQVKMQTSGAKALISIKAAATIV